MKTEVSDTALRLIETVRCLPVGKWRTTRQVHEDLAARGFRVSKRTVERDLLKLARPFGIDLVDNRNPRDKVPSGQHGTYEWRRTRSLEVR